MSGRRGETPRLPAAGPERERLRHAGQFWTPGWVAEAMVAYALADGARAIFDPAVGAGAFFVAAKRLYPATQLLGNEIDPAALAQAGTELAPADMQQVEVRDFVLNPPRERFPAIVANPPYLRHHRLPATTKARLQEFSRRFTGTKIDGRAGYHVYYFLRGLERLAEGGRLAYIVPADLVEGVFAPELWRWVARHYRLDAVVTFAAEATPFPGVDTNALILLLRRAPPQTEFWWAHCETTAAEPLRAWVESDFRGAAVKGTRRRLDEALETGLSRAPACRWVSWRA